MVLSRQDHIYQMVFHILRALMFEERLIQITCRKLVRPYILSIVGLRYILEISSFLFVGILVSVQLFPTLFLKPILRRELLGYQLIITNVISFIIINLQASLFVIGLILLVKVVHLRKYH